MRQNRWSFVLRFVCVCIAAGLVGGFAAAESSDSEERIVDPNATPAGDHAEKIENLARTDQVALLEYALANYKKTVRDYTGTFCKRERLDGKLGEKAVIEFKFMEKPFSVFMRWKKNADSADKILYVEGENAGKMLVHPTGLLSLFDSLKLDPEGKRARKSSRQPPTQFGFHRTLVRMLDVYKKAEKKGHLETRYLGAKTIEKRKCIGIERILPEKQGYETARLITYFDVEYALPTSSEIYDWEDKLLGEYSYEDLEFNVGLTPKEFTPKANGL